MWVEESIHSHGSISEDKSHVQTLLLVGAEQPGETRTSNPSLKPENIQAGRRGGYSAETSAGDQPDLCTWSFSAFFRKGRER